MTTQEIKVTIEYYPEVTGSQYMAYISEGEFANTIVTGETIAEVFKELGISLFVMQEFKQQ